MNIRYTLTLLLIISITSCTLRKECVIQIGNQNLDIDTVMSVYLKSQALHDKAVATDSSARQFCKNLFVRDLLYLAEASELGLAQEDSIRETVFNFTKHYLTRQQGPLFDHIVGEATPPSEEQLQDLYEKRLYEYKLAHILLPSKMLADSLFGEIDKGADFSEIADKYSIDARWGKKGGEWGYWFLYGSMGGDFDEQVVTADRDKPFGPIHTEYGYHIVKILDSRPRKSLHFRRVVNQMENIYKAMNSKRLYFEYQQNLPEKYNVVLDPQSARWIMGAYAKDDSGQQFLNVEALSAEQLNAELVSYKDGYLSVKKFIDYYNSQRQELLPPMTRKDFVEDYSRRVIMLDLLYLEAKALGMDRLPDVKQNVSKFEKNLLISTLEKRMAHPFEVTESDVKDFYDTDSTLHKYDFSEVAKWIKGILTNQKKREEQRRQVEELKKKYPVKFCKSGLTKLVQQMNAAKVEAAEIEKTSKK